MDAKQQNEYNSDVIICGNMYFHCRYHPNILCFIDKCNKC